MTISPQAESNCVMKKPSIIVLTIVSLLSMAALLYSQFNAAEAVGIVNSTKNSSQAEKEPCKYSKLLNTKSGAPKIWTVDPDNDEKIQLALADHVDITLKGSPAEINKLHKDDRIEYRMNTAGQVDSLTAPCDTGGQSDDTACCITWCHIHLQRHHRNSAVSIAGRSNDQIFTSRLNLE